MNDLTKVVAYLYAGIVAANAAEIITFNGDDYLKFSVYTNTDKIEIKKVKIDENLLNPGEVREITLIIPGEIDGKKVEIGRKAFEKLNSGLVELNIKFEKVTSVNGGKWVQLPKNCEKMFFQSNSITGVDFSGALLAHVKNANRMFAACGNIKYINFKDSFPWQIEDMSYMFDGCSSLINLDLSDFNTSNVTNMKDMFCGCTQLQNLNLSSFDTSNVTDMECMFRFCENLTNLDLRNFHTNNVQSARCMFMQCQNLTNLQLPANFIPKELNRSSMFEGCPGH